MNLFVLGVFAAVFILGFVLGMRIAYVGRKGTDIVVGAVLIVAGFMFARLLAIVLLVGGIAGWQVGAMLSAKARA